MYIESFTPVNLKVFKLPDVLSFESWKYVNKN